MSLQPGSNTATKFASCLNHLKHGSTAKTLFLPDENPNDFFSLLEDAFEQYQPATDHDAALVTRCIHDHWILLRRERTVDAYEAALHIRKPNPTYWVSVDLHEMHLFDRYKTEAARAYTRSLKNLQTIQKMARDDERWRHQLAKEKQRLALDLERFELLQAKQNSQPQSPSQPEPPPYPPEPEQERRLQQTIYIGFEDNVATHYETTPTNNQLRPYVAASSDSDQVIRTYNFVGGVPPSYRHLLTGNVYRSGSSTSVCQTLSAADWRTLAEKESKEGYFES